MTEPRKRLTAADLKPKSAPVPAPAPALSAKAKRAAKIEARRQKRLARIEVQLPLMKKALAANYPHLFGKHPKPLAKGITKDLLSAFGIRKRRYVMKAAVKEWTSQHEYRQAVAAGGPRYALDGSVAGQVSEEDVAHAREIITNASVSLANFRRRKS